jgi:uncharacterized protein YutE (UPF0331/DUF86 family)
MVDHEVYRRRAGQALHHIARLRRHVHTPVAEITRDEDAWNALLMDLQQAVQACVDLALHACIDERLGAPSNGAEAFALLAKAGRIDAPLSVRLAGATALRNLIVHQYGELDANRVLSIVRHDLGDLEALLRALAPA